MGKDSPFKSYERNVTSQFGEDGIIDEIFQRIGTENKLCVEFGAWDGMQFSNTWNLWHNCNWDAILIEADGNKFKELTLNTKSYLKVKAINKYVSSDGENSLENILLKLNVPKDFNLLSIDIDGDDYYIFDSLNNFNPKLIIIEYNPTIPAHLSIIQKKGEYFGSSALAIHELAEKKGYKLVHISDTNIFLVHKEYFPQLNIESQNILDIFPSKYLNYIFSSYDGELFISNNFIFGVKEYIKKLFSICNFKIHKESISKKFPFEPDSKTHKIIINNQIKNNASNI
jgi:hypothetical protein